MFKSNWECPKRNDFSSLFFLNSLNLLGCMDFNSKISSCRSVADVFELVKDIVWECTGQEQAGLLVGLSDLGRAQNGFIGAYYSPHSNIIIINNRAYQDVQFQAPELSNRYLFHIILHEYVHSLGFYDEHTARAVVFEIAKCIGDDTVIKMAAGLETFFPEIVLAEAAELPKDPNIYFVQGIDRKSVNYIG
jgi:hypothetical protein